jgi:hypothetical protein
MNATISAAEAIGIESGNAVIVVCVDALVETTGTVVTKVVAGIVVITVVTGYEVIGVVVDSVVMIVVGGIYEVVKVVCGTVVGVCWVVWIIVVGLVVTVVGACVVDITSSVVVSAAQPKTIAMIAMNTTMILWLLIRIKSLL